ncbi:VPA1269 family protein [Pelagibaculum spongiae]|uniref:Integrase n=1 Tax=Pelagibaculum spongiae TaxID=2080658 RepID=A0A2V1GV63_9GAMM|nr:VPA1269 family protein [Pelagibaculum spongiae]PVZ66788.1 hypothetical protein DC094_16130 [Pelagibaculum spongiae]
MGDDFKISGLFGFDHSVTSHTEGSKNILKLFVRTRKKNHCTLDLKNYFSAIPFLENLIDKNAIDINSYFFYQNSCGKKIPVTEFSRGCPSEIFNETFNIFNHTNELDNIKTKGGRRSADVNLAFALRVLHIITGIDSIRDLALEQFEAFITPLRTEKNRWKDDIDSHSQKALRQIANSADIINDSSSFQKVVTVQRSDAYGNTKDLFNGGLDYMSEWVKYWKSYLEFKQLYSTKEYRRAFSNFKDYLVDQYLGDDFIGHPMQYFSSYRNENFRVWLENSAKKNKITARTVISSLAYNNDFANWYIAEHLSGKNRGDLTTSYSIIPLHKITELKIKYLGRSSYSAPTESVKAAPPLWIVQRLKEILSEDDFAWPRLKSSEYDPGILDKAGNKVWIPVITYLYLTMLEIPLRKIQVLRLDSGEGDEHTYVPKTDKWKKNNHFCANYWKNNPAVKVANRGVLRKKKIPGSLTPSLSLYINSNKTSDRQEGFGEHSGYEIPWKNTNVIQLFHSLRAWQEKYNPQTDPVRYRDIPDSIFDGKQSSSVLKSIPDRFYLFRAGKKTRGGSRLMPPTKQALVQFWNDLIEELEIRLHAEGVDVQLVLTRNKQSGYVQSCYYTPHCLRVAGLTALAEKGVPLEVLSKIVAGHKSILMTLYYIKHHPSHITEILNEASKKVEDSTHESYVSWLKEASWDQVAKYSVYNSDDAINAIKSTTGTCISGLWDSTNFGVCPYAGTRCHDGGEIINKKGKKSSYTSVDDKNCVVCRHFITGLPWLNQLWVHANSLILKSEKKGAAFRKVEKDVYKLKCQRIDLLNQNKTLPSELTIEIKKTDALMEKVSKELDVTLNTLHATHNLIEKIKHVQTESNIDDHNENLPALLLDSNSDFNTDYIETPSNFASLDLVVQASRVYHHERNEDFERERDQFIDAILLHNNYQPLMLISLSEKEKQCAADALAKVLITQVNAEDLNLLRDGRISLQELGVDSSFSKVTAQLSSSIKKMKGIGCN